MKMPHINQQIHHPELVSDNVLHVVGVVSNPVRFHSRYRLAREWLAHMETIPHVKPYLVETAFGDRHHEIATDAANHLKLRSRSETWIKECMVNLGVRYLLPRDWSYVAWVDADVEFRDPNWAQESLHQLQHYAVIQPWQQCLDLGPTGNVLQSHQSFGWIQQSRQNMQRPSEARPGATMMDGYPFGHPGFAWAARRDLWEAMGGLLDHCILGSGDHHMAWGFAGDVGASIHKKCTAGYRRRCEAWAARAVRVTHGHVGFCGGRIEHMWHGPKKNRFYQERWQILIDHAYDPDVDLTYDTQGLIQLIGKPGLESALRAYNRSRNEDSIDE